jgi:hypothetical protein
MAETLPQPPLPLAGFALSHAAWSISDVPSGELLCPLVVTADADGIDLICAGPQNRRKTQ